MRSNATSPLATARCRGDTPCFVTQLMFAWWWHRQWQARFRNAFSERYLPSVAKERAMLKRELLTIYERMTEMEAAENGSLTTAMQRGASHIANLDKFVDVLEHASSLSSAEAAITIG